MAKFELAIDDTLKHEGGSKFTRIKHDRGGATKWGITLRTLRRWRGKASVDDVRQLTRSEACEIYRAEYWDACQCTKIHDQTLAAKVFDIAVNCGVRRASKMLQQAVMRVSYGPALVQDGIIGPRTVYAANQVNAVECLCELKGIQRDYYLAIIKRRPEQVKFKRGWLKRARWPEVKS